MQKKMILEEVEELLKNKKVKENVYHSLFIRIH